MKILFARGEGMPFSVYLISTICGSFFLFAGLAKAADPTALFPALLYDGVPQSLLHPLSLLVIFVEIALGLMLIFCNHDRRILLAGFVLTIAFSLQLLWFLIGGDPPECGCFGNLIEAKLSNRTSLFLGLARNVFMATGLGYACRENIKLNFAFS